jgi:hypothetical protein
VSATTVRRWLAEAGLYQVAVGEVGRLRELYVERQLSTREVAEQLGTSKNTVIRMLAAAGFPRRPRAARQPRGARAAGD